MKFNVQGPLLSQASFKAMERVLEMFYLVDFFFFFMQHLSYLIRNIYKN